MTSGKPNDIAEKSEIRITGMKDKRYEYKSARKRRRWLRERMGIKGNEMTVEVVVEGKKKVQKSEEEMESGRKAKIVGGSATL